MQSLIVVFVLSAISLGQTPAPSLPRDLPEVRLTEATLQDLQQRSEEICVLRAQVLVFAKPIGLRPDLAMEEMYDANFDLLIGRGLVLCKLQRALDDALRDRELLEVRRERYDRWLQLAKAVAAASPLAKSSGAQLKLRYNELEDLRNRWKVVCGVKLERLNINLKIEGANMSPPQKAALEKKSQKEMDGLAEWARGYKSIDGSVALEQKYQGMTLKELDAEIDKLHQEFYAKLDEYNRLRRDAGGTELSEAVLLRSRHRKALERCRAVVNETTQYEKQAEAVEANARHVADVLEEVLHAPLEKRNLIMLTRSGEDRALVEQLVANFSSPVPNTSGQPPEEGPLELPPK